jgi:hypothetical protein
MKLIDDRVLPKFAAALVSGERIKVELQLDKPRSCIYPVLINHIDFGFYIDRHSLCEAYDTRDFLERVRRGGVDPSVHEAQLLQRTRLRAVGAVVLSVLALAMSLASLVYLITH